MKTARTFASDNNAGVHPDVLAAIAAANVGHVPAYGDDPYTARAIESMRAHFGRDAGVFFVFGGTGANVLGLKAITEPHHAIVCADTAHIAVDECGAPERFTGCKLIAVLTSNGKLRPKDVEHELHGIGEQHHVQPRVIAISEVSEMGTVYTAAEIRALADFAHQHGMKLHMDGARLCNAAASLGTSLRALTTDAGVDVLSFGGTKCGLMGAEAVVFLTDAPEHFKYIRKQGMQLSSKMRFLAVQFEALLADELWRRNAQHANAMAQRLARGIERLPSLALARPVEANGVFVILSKECIQRLLEITPFYVWDEERGEVRWMTSFDTTEEDVDGFLEMLRQVVETE